MVYDRELTLPGDGTTPGGEFRQYRYALPLNDNFNGDPSFGRIPMAISGDILLLANSQRR
ncbi:MAG: hypothetical protein IPG81_18035 [Sandaracinaceae bacterium]|nr:hypothetical protein [Sandaracinaceae bacterium]